MSKDVAATSPRQGLWHHSDFLKIWTAATISLFGSQVSAIAIPAIAIITLGVSPFEAALLGFFEMLPFILFTLPAGVWVDRLRRRPILIAGDLGRAAALLTIPVAYAAGALTVWQLYAVAFTTGILTVFFDVADQSYLPSLLEADQLIEGNAKLQISQSAAQIAGQGVGGAVIGLVTAPFAVLADALSFLGSAGLIFLVRRRETPPERVAPADGTRGPGMRSEMTDGLRYVLGSPYLRNIAACTGTSNLFSSVMFSIYLVYLFRVVGLSPLTVGIVSGIGNIGFLIGAVMAGRVPGWLGLGRTILLAATVGSVAPVLVAVAPQDTGAIPFLILFGLIGGWCQVVYNVNQVSLRQAITPARMQGRMNATMRFIVWGTMPIGLIVGGVLGSTIGLHETIWVGAIGGVVAFLPILFSPVVGLREIPAMAEDAGAAAAAAPEAEATADAEPPSWPGPGPAPDA
ncbi:MAG TPA: MFS transporter [Candidatus Acidoferrum sp.]|nr:MFS transporter [Candidatus Acidoferrum sp.]